MTRTAGSWSRSHRAADVHIGDIRKGHTSATSDNEPPKVPLQFRSFIGRSRGDVADGGNARDEAIGVELVDERETTFLDRPE